LPSSPPFPHTHKKKREYKTIIYTGDIEEKRQTTLPCVCVCPLDGQLEQRRGWGYGEERTRCGVCVKAVQPKKKKKERRITDLTESTVLHIHTETHIQTPAALPALLCLSLRVVVPYPFMYTHMCVWLFNVRLGDFRSLSCACRESALSTSWPSSASSRYHLRDRQGMYTHAHTHTHTYE
jgi:hypothetical protein